MSDADRTTALADAIVDGLASERSGTPAHLLEIGIGQRTDVAAAIAAADVTVTAIDVVERSVPAGVAFQRLDLHELRDAATEGATVEDDPALPVPTGIYALRLPPELHEPFADLAAALGVGAAFTTLGGDPPAVSVTPEQLTGGETIFWMDAR